MLTFGYLTVSQRPADLVTFPDGAVELHPPGDGAKVIETWNAARVPGPDDVPAEQAEPDDDEVQETLDALTAAWEAELATLEREASPFGNPEGRRASFLRRNPMPTRDTALERLRAQTSQPRRRKLRAEHSARSEPLDACWWATLEADADGFEAPVHGPGPLPRRAIAQLLSRLSRDGWDVRHVSEERSAVHGRDESRVVCIGMNLMLSRSDGT